MSHGTRIKICGVTLTDDAARVAALGADYIGLNFWPSSRRYLEPGRANLVASTARAIGPLEVVGIFVDADVDDVREVLDHVDLDVIQLHGDEAPETVQRIAEVTGKRVWKAISVGSSRDLAHLEIWPADALLLDTPTSGRGGSGEVFDWSLAAEARRRYPARRLVLAGGLDATNVAAAIAAVAPWAVDVASGVEAGPGIKDPDRLAAFVTAARGTAP